ncbi:MAG TPA: glycosyltransferase family 1 protein [Patescibacteria group bacterium]|nr:glycosyltransferase family 1 protein [Patescibacteria group bacterium]
MIIGIDGNEANVTQRVGVNEYAFQIIKNLRKLSEKGENPHKLIVYLKSEPLPDLPKEMQNFKYKVIPGGGGWILTKLIPNLFSGAPKPDVFFSPSHYIPPIAPMPRVCSIMDIGYLEFSGQFTKKAFWQLKWWSAISIYISKAVIAISNSTKDDIVRHYPFAKNKTHAVPLAIDPDRFNPSIPEKDVRHIKNKYSIVDDYILYLGTLKPSKNIVGLITAFSLISPDFPKVKLVISGKKGWMFDEIFEKAEKLGLEDKIVFTGFVPEEEKPALIAGARVFVLPSYWEGFGLDALNAMASGVPVVASNAGSLPEVVGDSGVTIDPTDPETIAGGIKKVLTADATKYNSMVEAGISRAKAFSWEETARKTLKIIENVKR